MDIASLRINVDSTSLKKAERDLGRIGREADHTERAVVKMGKNGSAAMAGMKAFILQAASAFAAINLAREYIRIADSVTQLNNQLKLATGSAAAATSAYTKLFDVAQRSRVSFIDLGGTYATIARTTKELGLSQGQLLTVTEAIGNAMTISGGSAQSMNAALIQLGQGLGSGTLRGEELNSVMEQTPRLAQAIADGMGITIGQLRQFAQDGKLTAETVTRALQSQAGVLAGEVKNATLTFGQAMTIAGNSATVFIGAVDGLTGSSSFLAKTIVEVSKNIDALSTAFKANKNEASTLSTMLANGFAVVLETLSVLALNVSYVFKQVGNEIGGMAAQAVAFMSLDFSAAASIGQMMKKDAAQARAELDATTARILNARRLMDIAATGAGMDEPRFARLLNPTNLSNMTAQVEATSKAKQAANKKEEQYARDMADFAKAQDDYVQARHIKRLEEIDDLIKASQEYAAQELKAYTDSADSAQQSLQAMIDQEEAIGLSKSAQISLARAVELTTIARLKERQIAAMANTDAVMAIQREIDARMKAIEMMEGSEARQVLDDNEKAWKDSYQRIADSFVDAMIQGGEGIKTWLKNQFANLVLRPILAPIGGGVASLFGGSASAGTGGGASSLGGLGQIASLAGAFGTGMAASFSSMMAAGVSGWATAAGSLIGSGASAGIAAGLGMIAAPLLAVATLWQPLFGRKLKDFGVQGEFGGDAGFAGSQYQFLKGGLFRSNKTKTSALDPEIQAALAGQFNLIKTSVTNMGAALGLGAEALDGYTRKIKISTKGMTEAQVTEAWNKEFAAIGEDMAQRLLGTFETSLVTVRQGFLKTRLQEVSTWVAGPFIREGEKAIDALARLSSSIVTVNPILDTLGVRMFEISLAGADMASKLADAFGGLEAMGAATSAYYQAFYSETERTATATRQLTAVLAGMGLALPQTRDQFRALVESQDLYTDAGRATYAALIQLAPAFDSITSAMRDASNTVMDEVRRLRGVTAGGSLASLQAQFAIASGAARAWDAGALSQLPELSKAIEDAARLTARSSVDLALTRAWLASSMTETLGVLGMDVPAFANGGAYGGGLAMVGERGPELINFDRPGMVYSAAQTSSLMGGNSEGDAALVSEMRQLRSEVTMLRSEARATALNTGKTIRLLERVSRDGESLQVTTTDAP